MAEKQAKKQISAGLLGLLDPLIRRAAQELAPKIPGDSILRAQKFETFFGAVKGFAEAWSEKYPAVISALIEKLTDFLDFLSVAIADPEHRQSVAKWLDSFLEESGERLRNSSDPEKEFEKIKLELKLRKELYETAHKKPTDTPKEKPGDDNTEDPLGSLNAKLESLLKTMRSRKERRHGNAISAKNS